LARNAFYGEVVARVPRHPAYLMGFDVYFDNVGGETLDATRPAQPGQAGD